MATYFVKNGGSDSADGLSEANAWATVSKVNGASFSPGDSILFKRGHLWREQLTVPSSGSGFGLITFSDFGNALAAPLLNGADLITSWTDDGNSVWRATLNTQPQIVMFAGTLGLPVASKAAINLSTEWFWESNLLYVYATSNPNTFYGDVEASIRPTNGEAIFNFNGKSYVMVENIACKHSQNIGIKNYAASSGQSDRYVKNCDVAYTADGGICIYADDHFFARTVIERNDVSYANLRNAANGDGALEGITVMKADGYDIGSNTVHHCVEEGIDSHGQSKNGRIHDNHVHTQIGTIQFRPAIYADGGDNVEVDHNISHGYTNNLCKGLQLNCENASHVSNNMRYHHNIVYDCQTGWEIAVSGGGSGHSNVKVYNNIFYQCSQYGILFNSDVLNKLAGVNEILNNIFDASVSDDIRDFSTGNYGISNFTIDRNYFKTSNPSETQGTNAVVASSAGFVDPANFNFKLKPTSACLNAGVVIPGVNRNYAGTAPDLGATARYQVSARYR